MENVLTAAEKFAKNFMDTFLIQRDGAKTIDYLHPEASWIDLGSSEIRKNGETIIDFLTNHIAAHPEPFSYAEESYFSSALAENVYCVIVKARVSSDAAEKMIFAMELRVTCIVKAASDQSMQIVHLHASVPDSESVIGEILPPNSEQRNFLLLQQLLHEKTAEINNFYNILSGGVCKMAFDTDYTLIYASDYLLAMFGLTWHDIALHNNRTAQLVFAKDIPYLTQILNGALQSGEPFTAKYRIQHKSGYFLWVQVNGIFSGELYKNEFPIYYCIYTDITELVQSYEQIAREKERYRIITELTEGITFEYDLKKDCIEFPNKYEQYFNCPAMIANFKQGLTREYFASDEDYTQCQNLYQALQSGQQHAATELRFKIRDGSWVWFSVMLSTLYDENGQPIRAIGKLTDINQQKLEQQNLENRSRLDPMTGLANKIAAEQQIKNYLSAQGHNTMAAIFVIDIDNFKTINDRMGHFVGDHVICFIAEQMMKFFRKSDILGRFGGDEFVIFMKDIYAESLILEKASLLCKSVAATYHPEISEYQVTLSIGIAVTTGERPLTYQQLFQRADKALYAAKNNGKNRFSIYNTTMELAAPAEEAVHNDAAVKPYSQGPSYQILLDTALDILLQSDSEKTAIQSILKFLGVSLNLTQSYAALFAADEIHVIVQWSESEAQYLPAVMLLDQKSMLGKFNHNGIFLCGSTAERSDRRREARVDLGNGAILQCLICRNEKVIGFAGFSAKEEPRLWTQSEIDILQTITKVITNSVIKLAECGIV